MNTELTLLSNEGVTVFDEDITVSSDTLNGGERHRITFPNGRGASVICNDYSYGGDQGLFEVAVLNAAGQLDYTTPITDDVLGWLTAEDVGVLLQAIAALPAA